MEDDDNDLRFNSVWCNIIKLGKDLLNIGLDFGALFEKKLGDGGDTLFWDDVWVGGSRLKDRFPRLFRLEVNQNALEATGFGQRTGSWECKLDNTGVYKTRVMASKIDEILLAGYGSNSGTLRNNLIPQKVGIFIWRVLKGRIPVRMELDKRGVDLESILCPLCNDVSEFVEHAIFSCKCVLEIWNVFLISRILLKCSQGLEVADCRGWENWFGKLSSGSRGTLFGRI
ncbi:uncharacterized protein [Rutidosis leptorrhynchoides]|uniref:uncharacterized protein n=1 Tax=Rutidosis leptorrhynchoides TaxID=125765 RepID=UPI003A9912E2